MNDISLFLQPGFHCSSNGDMLGMAGFGQTLKGEYSDIQIVKCDYDQITTDYFLSNRGHTNILISHSYGGGWSVKATQKIDPSVMQFDDAIWFDPVKDFWKGQFRLFQPNWKLPPCFKKSIVFHQHNMPPTGCPFQDDPRLALVDVTSWGLYHCDIPSDIRVLEMCYKRLTYLLMNVK